METHTTHRTHPYSGGGGGGVSTTSGGGREDCWSEAASAVLIQSWGDRYLLLNRGNLRQKDWKDVADAVNSRQDVVKLPKTDVQCKNRIDTIKKKYKLEKSKPPPSTWPFFTRLDQLVGSNTPSVTTKRFQPPTPTPLLHKPPTPLPLPPVTFTVKPYNPNPNLYSGGSSSKSRLNNNNSGGSTRNYEDDENGDEDEEDEDEEEVARRKERMVEDSSEGVAFRELARAILKFGEVYERMESSKQEQMMELERQRMEFTKDLEFQRMQMFMEAQLELEKMKRPKYASGNGKKL